MAKYLDPKADVTFKKVFGEHKNLVISLLNALLPLDEGKQVELVEVLAGLAEEKGGMEEFGGAERAVVRLGLPDGAVERPFGAETEVSLARRGRGEGEARKGDDERKFFHVAQYSIKFALAAPKHIWYTNCVSPEQSGA